MIFVFGDPFFPKSRRDFAPNSPVSSRREKMKNNFQKSIDILRAVQYNTFCSEQKGMEN